MQSGKIISKPLVTMIVLSYNQENYISDAIDGALSQDYENLELVVCDDCSDDKTLDIIKEKYKSYSGPHSFSFFQTNENGGVVRNFNFALSKARGDLLVAAAGDDISYANRASKAVEFYKKYRYSAFYSFADVIDEKGEKFDSWKMKVNKSFYPPIRNEQEFETLPFYGAGAVYSREVFLKFGPIPEGVRNEDYNFFVRSLITSGIAYSKEPLLAYRKHYSNLSYWVKIKSTKNDFVKVKLRAASLYNQFNNMLIAKRYILETFGRSSQAYRSYERMLYSCALLCSVFSVIGFCNYKPYSKIDDLSYGTVAISVLYGFKKVGLKFSRIIFSRRFKALKGE